MKFSTHLISQILLMTLQGANQVIDIVPAKYKPVVVLVLGVIQAVYALVSHFSNPDGTPAALPYVKKLNIASILKSLGILFLALSLPLTTSCARSVTIPAPTPQPICPDITEKVKAVMTSNIDPAIKPTVTNVMEQNAKEVCAIMQKTHADEYAALLARAAEAGKNINSWVNTLLGGFVGGGVLGLNIATFLK